MGLDYSINLICKIVDNKTKEIVDDYCLEICYWRKCWHLCQQLIHNFASKSEYMIRKDEDFLAICKVEILPEIEKLILEKLKNRDSSAWSDSLWGATVCRQITYDNLKELTEFIEFISLINSAETTGEIEQLYAQFKNNNLKKFLVYIDEKGYTNLSSYILNFEVEFENSY